MFADWSDMNYTALREMLIKDEGLRLKPYLDSMGKLTIGVGRNLDDIGITKDEALFLLDNDIRSAIQALDSMYPWWRGLSDVRQHVLANMCFNIGIVRLSGFVQMMDALEKGDWGRAAQEMKNSHWYNQVGARAVELVSLMLNGQ